MVRPREGSGVVRRGEALRVDDESWFWTSEGARVESVDGREGACRACGRDIWGGGGGISGCLCKRVVSSLSRELWPSKFADRAEQSRAVLSAAATGMPCTTSAGGAHLVSLVSVVSVVSLVSTVFVLAVGQSVSQAASQSASQSASQPVNQSISQSVVGWACSSLQAEESVNSLEFRLGIQGFGIPLRRVPLSCALSPHGWELCVEECLCSPCGCPCCCWGSGDVGLSNGAGGQRLRAVLAPRRGVSV